MADVLRVLLVEASPDDATLLLRALARSERTVEHHRVETAEAMRAALEHGTWDVIVSDWALADFGAPQALALLREMAIDVPVIVASGTIGEELAFDAMRAGARDFVVKDRLARLLPAAEREIREAGERSARVRAEAAFERQEARFRALVEASADGIVLAGRDAVISYASPAALRMFGRPAEDVIGRTTWSLFSPDETAIPGAHLPELDRHPGARITSIRRLLRPDGSVCLVEGTLTNALENPAVGAIILSVRDITDRAAAERALSIARTRFDRLSESGVIGVIITTTDGLILDANDAYLALIRRSREEIGAGRVHWTDLSVVENAERDAAAGAELAATGKVSPWETAVRRPDGERVPVLCGMASLDAGSSIAFVVDLTERKRAEAALARAKERFAKLFESGIIGICVATDTGVIVESNDAFLDMVGYSRPDLEAGLVSAAGITPPEWQDRLARTIASVHAAGRVPAAEREYVRKDGSRVPALVGLTMLGREQILAVAVDLSDRNRAEASLRETEQQLRHAQKMEAVGRLAGGIAHDFNNVLSVILSHCDLLLFDLREGDPIREDVGAMRTAAQRASELTRQVLGFSRQQAMAPEVIDVGRVFRDLGGLLRRLLGETITLTVEEPTGLRVRVDPGSLEQVLMNFAVNARDAMPNGGRLTLSGRAVELEPGDVRLEGPMAPGTFVELRAEDTGTGMDDATRARIFEPFFTTKGVGKGTGLGLSTVFGIVQRSGGSIRVTSELHRGATFAIYLPWVDDPVEDSPAPAPLSARGIETILLVEDDVSLRKVARGILERSGYQVLEARDSAEALLLGRLHPGPIHLLLTDVVMPQLSGPEIAERLAAMRPETRVLCMSGYIDDVVVQRAVRDKRVAFLQKPITPSSLTQKVREVLDPPS